ncbi:MAG: 3-deoxy-D-manno-octulosonate 8-phosphate phosphatase [Ruminococcaceae bacterium]|nr:3-deoxy-D-manno-octulosonate 8-phosphate phosphatase [Oscillospiraceae bacterium]
MSIKLFVMDVDDTLTDGHIYFGDNGEMFKAFHVRDGYAIAHIFPVYGIIPVIITGKSSEIVARRSKELKINEVYQGISDKLTKLKEIADKYNVTPEEIAYIGDDVNDLDCMEYCGLTACPADALDEVLDKVNYVCKRDGGRGAVREFADYVIETYYNN